MGCTPSKPDSGNSSSGAAVTSTGTARNGRDGASGVTSSTTPLLGGAASSASSMLQGFREPSVRFQNIIPKAFHDAAEKMAGAGKAAAPRVRNVFAVPLEALGVDKLVFQPPVYEKSDEENDFIAKALKKNFVFETLHHRELEPLIKAFEACSFETGEVVIKQGDQGDFFYVVREGSCAFLIDGKPVGHATKGQSFGELALLYTCPRAATVLAETDIKLYRVDQKTFRFILQSQTEGGRNEKIKLLKGVSFLKDLGQEEFSKLSQVMTPLRFQTGQVIMKKGDVAEHFYILSEGELKATEISLGDSKFDDITVHPGEGFGELALVNGTTRNATVTAQTDGLAFVIDKDTFESTLGNLNKLILRSQDQRMLSAMKVFKDSNTDLIVLASLAKLIVDRSYQAGTKLMVAGQATEAALYFVRQGKVEIVDQKGNVSGNSVYFGEELLLADAKAHRKVKPAVAVPDCSVTVTEDCVCGVLTLEECRKVLETTLLGKVDGMHDSIVDHDVKLQDLERHKILGAGTFGQVWLVSRNCSDGSKKAYALKVQSKYELCMDGQASAVVLEKNIMAKLHHPFLINLVSSYQDENCVYLLMGLVQGGELYNVIHTPRRDGMPEKDARFYTAGIAEGLSFMHRHGYVYRDLKPENVLIDNLGYPVVIDFGFAKYVVDKTYTLCGTPLYLAPEVILNRGHNWGADHWSLGVLIFEMITGVTPFYVDGMDQMDLFRAIVKGHFDMPNIVSPAASSMIKGLLTKDPYRRLGVLARGEDDILMHPWLDGIDIEAMTLHEIKAPFVPKIKNPLDGSNFDDWSHLQDKSKTKYPKLTLEQEQIFATF